MSSALALAAVTETLRRHIWSSLVQALGAAGPGALGVSGDVSVTATAPHLAEREAVGGKKNLVNVFLFNVTRNPGWLNEGQPARGTFGDRVGGPPLALDLHYLVTGYGNAELHAEALMGHVMQWFHETGVLTRDAIRWALKPPPTPTPMVTALAASGLAEQFEQIKLSQEPVNAEEISRLWSAFNTHYRLTAAYQAAVVLIEAARPRRAALPVRAVLLSVPPFHEPEVDRVEVAGEPSAPILPDSLLAVRGRRLAAPKVAVRVNGLDVSDRVTDAGDEALHLQLLRAGLAAWPPGLRAGVAALQVVHPRVLGVPPTEHAGAESNAVAFVLRPAIQPSVVPGATATNSGGQKLMAGELAVAFTPPVGRGQRVTLLLNERQPDADRSARAYSFPAPPFNGLDPADETSTETGAIRFAFRRVVAGSYLVRVQVDGAESLLDADPVTGAFLSPSVTIGP